ncbi:MAG: aminotransferase class V-fold PLP-dependent enzyme [Planctomycetes bacterium]|nr:aminotransferase class V-fold PLP-dependent enzyme [Planctomycetota bacterium]
MPIPLYLDAARMGRMSPSTRSALQEFVRFAGEYGGTLYFDDFLRHGFSALPDQLRRIHPGLTSWQGIQELLETLNAHAGQSSLHLPLLANRTANLVRLAAKSLFAGGRRVLVTDLIWPSYARILRKESAKAGAHIIKLRLREAILLNKIGPSEVAQCVADAVERLDCHGMFLPAVSHDGIRFPLDVLADIIRQRGRRRFLAVDGAQAFCHVPLDMSNLDCDFLVTGSHKWLGAYLPLGIGFVRNPDAIKVNNRRGAGDPLLNFLLELHGNTENRFGETVNLMPLFSCRAALAERRDDFKDFAVRKANADALAAAIDGDWQPVMPDRDMRSGILLVNAKSRRLQRLPAARMRAHFLSRGISLTTYDSGRLRLAMPFTSFNSDEIECLRRALHEARNISSFTNRVKVENQPTLQE